MVRQLELVDTPAAQNSSLGRLDAGSKNQGAPVSASIQVPVIPLSVEETGLKLKFLGNQILKTMSLLGYQNSPEIGNHLKLSPALVDKILVGLKQQGYVEILGSSSAHVPILRYGITSIGQQAAAEAYHQCEYLGPVPVTLDDFRSQVRRQSITREWVSSQTLEQSLAHLVVPKCLIRRLGPAVNSGRALLFYGPPGNGKTSISEAVGRIFTQHIYIPYCMEVDGQIIKVFDPTVHHPVMPENGSNGNESENIGLLKRKEDPRWVKCRRPVITVGGELTLEMLDLDFDSISKHYEAPEQLKASGGVFIIDDFGRQLVRPKDLLNRWIVPLEKRIDFLTIHTGKKFEVPFDQLLIFSTNIPPNELMDAALLRRVKYKLRIDPPQFSDYIRIFRRVCEDHGLEFPEGIMGFLLNDYYPKRGLPCAAFHPIFIVEHAMAACRFAGVKPCLTLDLVKDALANLYIQDQADYS